jgi:hypothetical protein
MRKILLLSARIRGCDVHGLGGDIDAAVSRVKPRPEQEDRQAMELHFLLTGGMKPYN